MKGRSAEELGRDHGESARAQCLWIPRQLGPVSPLAEERGRCTLIVVCICMLHRLGYMLVLCIVSGMCAWSACLLSKTPLDTAHIVHNGRQRRPAIYKTPVL